MVVADPSLDPTNGWIPIALDTGEISLIQSHMEMIWQRNTLMRSYMRNSTIDISFFGEFVF
jgi:hypothetical protein